MLEFLTANIGTIIILLIVIAIVAAIVVGFARNKKKGKSSGCGCGCASCPMSESCHGKVKKQQNPAAGRTNNN